MGTMAKINLALSALPEFTALKSKGNGDLLRGRIQVSPEIDYLDALSTNRSMATSYVIFILK